MKTPKTKSKSLNAQLLAYSATAVVAVLAAPEANAAIHTLNAGTVTLEFPLFIPTSTTVTFGSFGAFAVQLQGIAFQTYYFQSKSVKLHIPGGLQASGAFAANLAGGAAIGPVGGGHSAALAIGFGPGPVRVTGNFEPASNGAKTGYVGFKTNQNAQTYYGWLRVQVTADGIGYPATVSLVSEGGVVGAYGLPGDGLTAGQIAATPEPGTLAVGGLGLLALGARGLRELRRRRETAAKN